MDVLVLGYRDVRRLLPMPDCIEVMRDALMTYSRGEFVQPMRSIMWLPERRGALGLMPGALLERGDATLGVKVVSIFPGNVGATYESHQGAVLLFDAQHGCLRAVVDAGEVTAIRTAAVSAVATHALANEDAGDLALLGSGTQARTHLEAMCAVRNVRRVRVWSRNAERAQQFAKLESQRRDVPVEACSSVASTLAGADLICTTTAAREPLVQREWIAAAAHINAVGACIPSARELDSATVQSARVFVDSRESAAHEAGDLLIPQQEGVIDDGHIVGEIGEVLSEQIQGRRRNNDITLFKSLGIAVEDVAVTDFLYRRARAKHVGVDVEIGGLRDAGD